jgi:hypothetical protein
VLSSGSILFLVPLFRFWRALAEGIEGAVSLLRGHFLTLLPEGEGCFGRCVCSLASVPCDECLAAVRDLELHVNIRRGDSWAAFT